MSQINSNLLKETFATWQHASLSTSITVYDKILILDENVTYVVRLFVFSFSLFSYLFAAVVNLPLGLPPAQEIQRKHHWDGKFLLNFWAFSCIFQAQLTQSLWNEYHWKDLVLLKNLSISDAGFGQRQWCQKWNKGQCSSHSVTAGTGNNGLKTLF